MTGQARRTKPPLETVSKLRELAPGLAGAWLAQARPRLPFRHATEFDRLYVRLNRLEEVGLAVIVGDLVHNLRCLRVRLASRMASAAARKSPRTSVATPRPHHGLCARAVAAGRAWARSSDYWRRCVGCEGWPGPH